MVAWPPLIHCMRVEECFLNKLCVIVWSQLQFEHIIYRISPVFSPSAYKQWDFRNKDYCQVMSVIFVSKILLFVGIV